MYQEAPLDYKRGITHADDSAAAQIPRPRGDPSVCDLPCLAHDVATTAKALSTNWLRRRGAATSLVSFAVRLRSSGEPMDTAIERAAVQLRPKSR